MDALPIGEKVLASQKIQTPARRNYEGQTIALKPVDPTNDAPALFQIAHGSPEIEQLWTYMAYGPFAHAEAMETWMTGLAAATDPLFLTVHHNQHGPVGMVSFLNIVPVMRRLELGNIWYGPPVWRTNTNTEAAYLMMSAAFDDWGYRRVEWKCDALNQRSRNAALRLGFSFEGVFRQHMIVKGRNRDTAWFAITDQEWPAIKDRLHKWLYHNPDGHTLASV